MRELIITFAMSLPCDYMIERQWFGVTERTLIYRSGIGLRLSSWCNGEQVLGFGSGGVIVLQGRIW